MFGRAALRPHALHVVRQHAQRRVEFLHLVREQPEQALHFAQIAQATREFAFAALAHFARRGDADQRRLIRVLTERRRDRFQPLTQGAAQILGHTELREIALDLLPVANGRRAAESESHRPER